MVSLSLVIPAFNEEASLEAVVRRYIEELQKYEGDFEIILLDDGSTDRTRAIIHMLVMQYPTLIFPVFHKHNQGMATAYECAQRRATKEYVFLLHGDGQYPPEVISICLPLLQSSDILVCRRRDKHYSLYRTIISSLYRILCRVCFGIDLWDPGGAKVIRRDLIAAIPIRSRSTFSQAERVIRSCLQNYRIQNVEIPCLPRRTGKAMGGNVRNVGAAFCDLIVLWWELRKPRLNVH